MIKKAFKLKLIVVAFSQTLYKTQVRELKEDVEEGNKHIQSLQTDLQMLQEDRYVA